MTSPDYADFIRAKAKVARQQGFDIDPATVNPALKPHIRAIVPWMLAGGRRAFFGRFGMQKTTAHLECMRQVMLHKGGPTLVAMPLGARLSFFRDAAAYFTGEHAIRLKFIRSNDEIRDCDLSDGSDDWRLPADAPIYLTNFESIREGKVDPRLFTGASLDEGDILRSFGGTKTFREFMRLFADVKYRFVATATPDPNEYIELLAYADFLGVMETGEAKTRFFKRDSTKADKLTIHPHKEEEFWLWVASWALFLQKPSDLGPQFSDEGYDLPPLDIRWHEVPTNHATAAATRDGNGALFKNSASNLADAAREKRESLNARIAKVMELRAERPAAHRILWHDLEDERRALEKAIPGLATAYGSQDIEVREAILMGFAEGRIAELGGKPMQIGSGGNYQEFCWWAIFAGIGFKFKDIIQAVHRIQRYGQRFHRHPATAHPKDRLDYIRKIGGDVAKAEELDRLERLAGTPSVFGPTPAVRLDFVYTEAERDIRRILQEKWARYEDQATRMSTDEPMPTQTAVHSPVLIAPYYGTGSGETCNSANEPLPTVTAKARFGMVVPVTNKNGGPRARDAGEPLPTMTTAKGGEFALVVPVTHAGGEDRAADTAAPLPTVTGANRGELAFVTAQFGERDGQAPRVHDLAAPATVGMTLGKGLLIEPTAEYDILFRMLEPDELGAAMGFIGDGVNYQFAGTKTQKIKQIGNAVSVKKMKACVMAIMADAAPRQKVVEEMNNAAEAAE